MAIFAIIAAVTAVASAALSIRAGKKATKAQRVANAAQRKINRLKNKQAKRTFLRSFRQAQANVLTSSVASGAGLESSAFQATTLSEQAQVRLGIKEFKEFDRLGGEFSAAQDRASRQSFKSAAFGTVSSFAASFIGGSGGDKGGEGE